MKTPEIIPFSSNRVWRTYIGGKNLDLLEGRELAADNHYPEDWIGSTTRAINPEQTNADDGLSKVIIQGNPLLLKDVFTSFGKELLGEKHLSNYGSNAQFLLKFLDSSMRLHIQCHPTKEFSRKYLGVDNGKTEAYLILKIREDVKDPFIYFGFQKEISKEIFKRAVERQDIESLLGSFEKIPVKEGDIFLVPGGLPHAIGAGIFMVEIMEPTDLTVRFEFDREGIILPETARFMDKGVDFALKMVNFAQLSIDEIKEQFFITDYKVNSFKGESFEEILIDSNHTDCFSVKKLYVHDTVTVSEDSFYYAIVLNGSGKVSAGDSELSVSQYDRFCIPYSTQSITASPDEPLEILMVFPPGYL